MNERISEFEKQSAHRQKTTQKLTVVLSTIHMELRELQKDPTKVVYQSNEKKST